MVTGLIGKKVGMTQLFLEDGTLEPATVLQAGPCIVVQSKSVNTDGYDAVQLGLVECIKPQRIRKPAAGHLKKAGVDGVLALDLPVEEAGEFRAALENAIKGKSANQSPFSIAWATGKLSRAHLARWAENHYHYVGPFADYLGYIYSNTPDHATDAKDFLLQNMYEEELSDVRHTDLLMRFAEACGTTRERVMDIDNATAVTRGLQGWCYAIAMREHFAKSDKPLFVFIITSASCRRRSWRSPTAVRTGIASEVRPRWTPRCYRRVSLHSTA